MSALKAVIFTEAGKNFGLGHLSRCIALKSYLQNADFAVEIYNRGDYESANATNANWLENPHDLIKNAVLIVIDSYYAPFEFYAFALQNAKICVALDDFSRIAYPKDCIILNPALNAKRLYNDKIQNEIFAGVEYGLLRKEFRSVEPKKISKEINKVLITLGGNDFANNTQKALDIVQKELSYSQISVVLPRYYEPLNCGFGTQIHANLSARELKDLMIESDLIICGGGVTAVEVQSTRTPSIALEIAPNQSYQLRQWQKVGLRIAQNPYALKPLIKSLVRLKDRNKVYNLLNKVAIGAELPKFVEMLKKRVLA
ncbi:hypothetical protein [Helicobacter sp. 23-1045]